MASDKAETTTIYTPLGKPLEVNDHMVDCLKRGDPTLAGFSLEKPKKADK